MNRIQKSALALLAVISALAIWSFLSPSLHVEKGQGSGHQARKSAKGDSVMVAVDASVYRGLMKMLGIGSRCIDFSDAVKPDAEQVAASGADMLMLSMYDGIDVSKYSRTGIRIIRCSDFNETTPLRRARWMKHYGRLWGVGARADSLYRAVSSSYYAVKNAVVGVSHKPSVFFDLMYGGMWYQPSERSTIGSMVVDAGGSMPFGITQNGGSKALSKEQVLSAARDADVWIIRYQSSHALTLRELASMNPVYSQFKAFRSGNVWAVNTEKVAYFDESPFRPDRQLEDFLLILHPELSHKKGMYYFSRVK